MAGPSSSSHSAGLPKQSPGEKFWLSHARKTARQVNSAWWLEMASAPLLIASLVGAAALLLVRGQAPDTARWIMASSLGGSVVAIAIISWILARRKFENPEASLVRIEAEMGLHNSLSSARAGIGPWPKPVLNPRAGLRWHWPRLIVPPLAAIAILTAGLLIPVSSQSVKSTTPEEPQAWLKLDSQLDELEQQDVVDEDYLDEMEKRLEQLRAQKEDEWFSHSSLEATDTLEKSHKSEMDRLQRDLKNASNALESLQAQAGKMNDAQKAKLLNDYEQALESMQNGNMKPNSALLNQLKQLDPKNLENLSPEQMQQLRENMQKHQQALREQGAGEGGDWQDELLDGQDGEGNGKEGQDGEGEGENGKGGVNRGPGHAPGVLGDEKDPLETGDLTGLEAKDLSNALPGDLLQLQNGEHEVDLTPSQIQRGGDTSATGSGGNRVWQDSLDPDEQRTLKRFYE